MRKCYASNSVDMLKERGIVIVNAGKMLCGKKEDLSPLNGLVVGIARADTLEEVLVLYCRLVLFASDVEVMRDLR
jgi:hypothetical protein